MSDLTDEEREELDERIAADLWGYYLHFDATGDPLVDRILSAVGLAAKAYHHTEWWGDEMDFDYGPIRKGESCEGFIQKVALDSARLIREEKRKAWNEGYVAGRNDYRGRVDIDGFGTPNPYEKEDDR